MLGSMISFLVKSTRGKFIGVPLACPVCVLVALLSIRQKSMPYLCNVAAAMHPAGPAPTIRTSVLCDLKPPN